MRKSILGFYMLAAATVIGFSLDSEAQILRTEQFSLDPFVDLQWGLHNQGLPQKIELDHITAYLVQARKGEDVGLTREFKGQRKIRVAVLDTGVDWTHPDLAGVIKTNPSECKALAKFEACLAEQSRATCEKIWMNFANPEVDQDHNGYPLDCHGWSILGGVNSVNIMGRPDFNDEQGHGTHVAGIIAAQSQNHIGISGVSSNVEIIPIQVLGNKPSEPMKPLSQNLVPPTRPEIPREKPDPLDPSEKTKARLTANLGDLVARGVTYAIAAKADIISFSMGWPQASDSEFLRRAIQEAQNRGILVVAAAGNDSTRALLRPCAYPNVICVAAHGPDGSLSHFSNYGSSVDVAAPGTNILSTWPQEKRPVRFRSTQGYEFLSGTSQATPFVTGLAAELLARQVPAEQVRARLILSGRPLQEKLPLLEGSAEQLKEEHRQERGGPLGVERKWLIGGLVDLTAALSVRPQPLILPLSKERSSQRWNTHDAELTFRFDLINLWTETDADLVKISARTRKLNPKMIRPEVSSIELVPSGGNWKPGQVRQLLLKAKITDARPEESMIPSVLEFDVQINSENRAQKLVLESELVVPVTASSHEINWQKIPLKGMPQMRTSLVPIDENLDGKPKTDYLAIATEAQNNIYTLIEFDPLTKSYNAKNSLKIRLGEDIQKSREQFLVRQDLNFDDKSEYVLGLYVDRSEDGKPSPVRFYFLDSDFKLQSQLELKSDLVPTPSRVFWHRYQGHKRPAWVGAGKNPNKKSSLREDWENPEGREKSLIRFYYTDRYGTLKSIERHEGFVVVDALEPTRRQTLDGRVPILLAKNRGTKTKPSYIYDFATAEVIEGQVENFRIIDFSTEDLPYRNFLDTRVDKVLSLDVQTENDPHRGTFWFSEGPDRTQRLTLLLKRSDEPGYLLRDATLPALRGTVDSSLWVRAAFAGKDSAGAFVLTNTELEYFDLLKKQVVSRSFERYTFYPDLLFSNLHFPAVILEKKRGELTPVLFTTESSGFTRGVNFKVPLRDQNGDLVEINTPARLRLESTQGCRPLETPIPLEGGGAALDYYCGSEIIRVPLVL